MTNTFIVNGKYSASNEDFIYYESGNNCFRASISNEMVEVYYGDIEGGGEYYDLPLTSKEELLKICDNRNSNTRELLKYAFLNHIIN